MKIVTIIGARPQFIKAAVVSRVFKQVKNIEEIIVHTGQHFDSNMSDIFFEEMGIPKPDYNLNINGLGHGAMTGQMLEHIEEILLHEKPDWVLVYGDTNSTLAGALAAKKLHIRLAHVEAGLRSFDLNIPEEVNRVLTDRVSDILFCPTELAVSNLRKEGYDALGYKIVMHGDVMQDAALFYADKAMKPKDSLPDKFILSTIHRAENTDNAFYLKSIFEALEEISSQYYPVVIPLHPRTKMKLHALSYDFENSKIYFISPVGYLEMIYLLKSCELVICDSGGLQKESYFFSKYCVFVHETETPWKELKENGFLFQTNPEKEEIMSLTQRVLLKDKVKFEKRLYGIGNAGEKVMKELIKHT